jgi:hypothetical protein
LGPRISQLCADASTDLRHRQLNIMEDSVIRPFLRGSIDVIALALFTAGAVAAHPHGETMTFDPKKTYIVAETGDYAERMILEATPANIAAVHILLSPSNFYRERNYDEATRLYGLTPIVARYARRSMRLVYGDELNQQLAVGSEQERKAELKSQAERIAEAAE